MTDARVIGLDRICNKCGLAKSRGLFPSKGGQCKSCVAEASHARYMANRDRNREWAKEYLAANREAIHTRRALARRSTTAEKAEYDRTWRASPEGKAVRAKAKLKSRYGITPEFKEQMMLDQDGQCRICGIEIGTDASRAVIDHDHRTDEIRGLLCIPCNVGLGSFHDDIDLLMAAAAYLLRSRNVLTPIGEAQ